MIARTFKCHCLWIGLGLTAATLAVYWPVRQHAFINYDDPSYVTNNPQVLAGLTWSGLRWACTTFHASNWHPLTWLSHMLDVELFGLKPGGHHFTNVLLHVLNAVLLFLVLQALTARGTLALHGAKMEGERPASRFAAECPPAFVAALFALHPLHVESVAWVSERKDVLSTLFWILTIGAYAKYARIREFGNSGTRQTGAIAPKSSNSRIFESPIAWYLLTLLCFALGLMSKPMLVTLPFVLLLLDWWPLRRCSGPALGRVPPSPSLRRTSRGSGFRVQALTPDTRHLTPLRLLLEKLPFFALSAASCWITLLAQRTAIAPLEEIPLSLRAANAVVACARYLEKTLWPVNLSAYYPLQPHDDLWRVAGAAALLIGLTLAALANVRRRPWVFVGWCWFWGTLLPVIGLVQVGGQSMADRYTYIPMIGLSLMVAWLLPPAWTGRKVIRQALIITAIALSTTWGLLARAQVRHWKDGETLFRHALAVTTDNDLAHKNLGNILRQQGRYDEAIGHYEQALRINPNYTVARIGLAVALRETGKVQEAAAHYEQALRLDPGNVEARNNLANICFQSGRFDEAIGHYMQALRLSPDHAEVHKNLGAALLRIGDTAQAIRHYEQALTLALATGQQTLAMDVEHRLERVRHIQSPPGAP